MLIIYLAKAHVKYLVFSLLKQIECKDCFVETVTLYVDGAREATAALRYPTDINKKPMCHLCIGTNARARDTVAPLPARLGDVCLYSGTCVCDRSIDVCSPMCINLSHTNLPHTHLQHIGVLTAAEVRRQYQAGPERLFLLHARHAIAPPLDIVDTTPLGASSSGGGGSGLLIDGGVVGVVGGAGSSVGSVAGSLRCVLCCCCCCCCFSVVKLTYIIVVVHLHRQYCLVIHRTTTFQQQFLHTLHAPAGTRFFDFIVQLNTCCCCCCCCSGAVCGLALPRDYWHVADSKNDIVGPGIETHRCALRVIVLILFCLFQM
jgi:hypothetical protein